MAFSMLATMFFGLLLSTPIQSASPLVDFLLQTIVKTIETPITPDGSKTPMSAEIMLENDVFTLDDALRLFIQQFLLALMDNRVDLLPEDWEQRYPAYSRIISGVNDLLNKLEKRKLNEISMKDIRSLTGTLTPKAFVDVKRLIRDVMEKIEEEKKNESDASKEEL